MRLFEHRDGAAVACQHGHRRQYADRLPVRHGLAADGVEHMAIAPAVEIEVALVIAAGGQAALRYRQRRHEPGWVARVLDADQPGLAVGLGADDADVTGQIDIAVLCALRRHQAGGAVGGVLFAEAAEIDLHAGLGQAQCLCAALDTSPADEPLCSLQYGVIRQLRALEIPGLAQHAGADVEQPAAGLKQGLCVGQQRPGFVIASHRRPAGGGVDARDDAVGAVARILGFDAGDFVDRCAGPRLCLLLIRRRQHHLAGAGHGAEGHAEAAQGAAGGGVADRVGGRVPGGVCGGGHGDAVGLGWLKTGAQCPAANCAH